MVKLFYKLFIILYPLGVKLVSPFNPKAKAWIKGRQLTFTYLAANICANDRIVWIHCASLGEFEQGKPLIEQLFKNPAKDYKILVTFFSPSGYEASSQYPFADLMAYLPMDSAANATLFLQLVHPLLVVFIKYEFWYYLLKEVAGRNIPLLLISGIFRADQPFFKWYGHWHRQMLPFFTHFFVQNQQAADLLKGVGYNNNVSVSGDTRFDRVTEIADTFVGIPFIDAFCGNSPIVVAGSTWPDDDKELNHFANNNPEIKFIIAPHNIISDRIAQCLQLYTHSATYTQLQQNTLPLHTNTLIIDNIGMLKQLYKYGTVCYVGGAFGADGVHNVLEPAIYGRPIIFGPTYSKYIEAIELVDVGGAKSIYNALELEAVLNTWLQKGDDYFQASVLSRNYVLSKTGSTEKIVEYIYKNRLLTS